MRAERDDDGNGRGVRVDAAAWRRISRAMRAAADTTRELAVLSERVRVVGETVERHDQFLFRGNGHSILTRVAQLESERSGRDEVEAADRSGRWAYKAALVAAAGLLIGSFVTSLLAFLQSRPD